MLRAHCLVALWHPQRHQVSLWEALAMQTVGVLGESLILFSIPAGHPLLRLSLMRFIIADTIGVLCLIGALAAANGGRPPRGAGDAGAKKWLYRI